jgi:hypothetical protein
VPEVSVAWVEAGRVLGFGRRFEGGIWIRRVAAAVKSMIARSGPSEDKRIAQDGLVDDVVERGSGWIWVLSSLFQFPMIGT